MFRPGNSTYVADYRIAVIGKSMALVAEDAVVNTLPDDVELRLWEGHPGRVMSVDAEVVPPEYTVLFIGGPLLQCVVGAPGLDGTDESTYHARRARVENGRHPLRDETIPDGMIDTSDLP